MKFKTLCLYLLLLSCTFNVLAESVVFEDKKLMFENKTLRYKSSNINFEVPVRECHNKIIESYLKKFTPIKKSKMDMAKELKKPVNYTLNGKALKTNQASKINGELESISKQVMLLKFKVEKKC